MAKPCILNDLKKEIDLGLPQTPLIIPTGLDEFAVRLAGVKYRDYSNDASVIFTVWDKAIKRFDLDWAGVFVDDIIELEPFGLQVKVFDDHPRAASVHLAPHHDMLRGLRMPDPASDGRMPAYLEASRRLRKSHGGSILISKSIASPFTAVTLLFGVANTLLLIHDDPELLHEIMRFVEKWIFCWAASLHDAGTDMVFLGDDGASSRFLSVEQYKQFALEPAQRVTAGLKKTGLVVVYHAAENKMEYLNAMSMVGSDILSLAEGIEMSEVKDVLGKKVCLMGNIDTLHVLWHGTTDEIRQVTSKLTGEVASRGGYIVNTGEGIPGQVPEENIMAMIQTTKELWPGKKLNTRPSESQA